jgi:hypothetical protein
VGQACVADRAVADRAVADRAVADRAVADRAVADRAVADRAVDRVAVVIRRHESGNETGRGGSPLWPHWWGLPFARV